jgi:hypothetical protein
LIRVGLKALAAGAACAAGFVTHLWLADDAGPAVAASRAPARIVAAAVVNTVFQTVDESPARDHGVISLHADARPIASQGIGSDLMSPAIAFAGRFAAGRAESEASFADRFAVDRSAAAAPPPASFADRFRGEIMASRAPVPSVVAAARPTVTAAPGRTARAAAAKAALTKTMLTKTASAKAAPQRPTPSGFQLASASDTPVALAYAPADSATADGMPGVLSNLTPRDPLADLDPNRTAIYDISAGTVYLPNGRRLEAHSGLGQHRDDPRSVALRNVGVTPPNVYDLRMREARFHGVRAIRLIPRDTSRMYGRSGILAHTYMLGPNGQSNGCVSFKDYQAFLDAYERGEITRLVVVERLAGSPPSPKTAADWLANTVKSLFQRS